MPQAKRIAQIDILVYPFFLGGYELNTKAGGLKFRQWLLDMNRALTTQDRAFVIIEDTQTNIEQPKEIKLKGGARKMHAKFMATLKKLEATGLAYSTSSGQPLQTAVSAARIFSAREFEPTVKILLYGQHAGACSRNIGGNVEVMLASELHRMHGTKFGIREHTGRSTKDPYGYVRKLSGARMAIGEPTEFIEAVKNKEISLFAIRKPEKVMDFLKARRQRK